MRRGTEPWDKSNLGLSIAMWKTASSPPGTSTFPVRWVIDVLLFSLGHDTYWDQFFTVAWPSSTVQSLTRGRCYVNVRSIPLSYAHSYAELPSLSHLWHMKQSPGLLAYVLSFPTTVLPGRYYHLHFTKKKKKKETGTEGKKLILDHN